MANVYRYRRGPLVDRWVAKNGAVAVELGDILKLSSGKVTPASSTDSTSLVGVALSASPATDATSTKIRFAEIGHGTVFEFAIAASDTQRYGNIYTISGNQQLTKKTVVDLNYTATAAVAMCAEYSDGSVSNALVSFFPNKFGKPIGLMLGAGSATATFFGQAP